MASATDSKRTKEFIRKYKILRKGGRRQITLLVCSVSRSSSPYSPAVVVAEPS